MRQLVLLSLALSASVSGVGAEPVPFTSDRWDIQGEVHRLEPHLGRDALFLQNGRALLTDVDFRDGTIEVDVAFPLDRGFSGVRFRAQDEQNYEEFYLRPHQTGQPDASQYQPVFNGTGAWQILYGPRWAAHLDHQFDTWQPVKVVVRNGEADIYVNSTGPVLRVALRRADDGGGVGVFSGFAPAHFSNFRVSVGSGPELVGEPAPVPELPEGIISAWEVSSPFPEGEEPATLQGWSRVDAGDLGLVNLARVHERRPNNTVVARTVLESDGPRTVALEIAFSDRVVAFVNGVRVFQGNDGYRTRDHRFLGTVGFYDTLWIPLVPGRNEVSFAVSEDFGGWVIGARLPDASGITVRRP